MQLQKAIDILTVTDNMTSLFRKLGWTLLLLFIVAACRQRSPQSSPNPGLVPADATLAGKDSRAIYHWRTTFAPDSTETAFLRCHDIRRIYLRMFDVATEHTPETGLDEVVPIATTRFTAAIPDGVEIVPTVYITLEALRAMRGKEAEYAKLIVERMRAMASYNGCGPIREMQFDCDWTDTTCESYAALCLKARELLHGYAIAFSITVRLHQLSGPLPPADCGVLMLYNTGALKNPATRNSILDIADVRPYLRSRKCDLPLAYAYPAFGWGVKFRNGQFRGIVSRPEEELTEADETIRIERPTADEVLAVKSLVEQTIGAPACGRIIYHLDCKQLKNYTDNEIDKIYAHN